MSGFFSDAEVESSAPSLVPKCGACGLYRSCASPKMPVSGKGKRRILLVGGFPEEEDDEAGRHFAGPSGEMVREQLDLLGVDMDRDTWQTNALICRPYGEKNSAPDDKRISHCRPSLVSTIEELKPRVIVLLGRFAVGSFMPLFWKSSVGEMERWLGWVIPSPLGWVIPTYAPSTLRSMENNLLNRAFAYDLEKAVGIEEDVPVPLDCASRVRVLYDDNEVEACIRSYSNKKVVAVDYETNCLKPEYTGGRIYSVALSDGRRAHSFPWSARVQEMMGAFFRNKDVRKIAANLKFEERWTRWAYGHGMSGWMFDTMLAAHCLDNRPGICSLKFQSWVRLGVPTYNEHIEPFLGSGKDQYLNRIHEIPLADLLFYGGMDALLEYRLAALQRKELFQ